LLSHLSLSFIVDVIIMTKIDKAMTLILVSTKETSLITNITTSIITEKVSPHKPKEGSKMKMVA